MPSSSSTNRVTDLVARFEADAQQRPHPRASQTTRSSPSIIRGSLSTMDWRPIERLSPPASRPPRRSMTALQPTGPTLVPPSVRRPEPHIQKGISNVTLGLNEQPMEKRKESPRARRHTHCEPSGQAREQPRVPPPPSPPPATQLDEQRPAIPLAQDPSQDQRSRHSNKRPQGPTQQPESPPWPSCSPSHIHRSRPPPLPASRVFSSTSLPLHLPELDAHLSNSRLFFAPCFAADLTPYSREERELYGLEKAKGDGAAPRELAGDQLKLCGNEATRGMRRRRGRRRGGFQELDDNDDDSCEEGRNGMAMSDLEEKPSRTSRSILPPLQLLNTTSTLNELKSNAVGPRSPASGWLASIPSADTIIGSVLDTLIGVEGSSFAASLFRFGLLRDFAQMMRLNLTFTSDNPSTSKATHFLFSTLPSILALDFVSVFGLAVIFLLAWFVATAGALGWFWRMTSAYDPNRDIQGLEGQPYIFRSPRRGTKAANVVVTFLLMTLYIPLTKLAMDVLVWEEDFWVKRGGEGGEQPDCWSTAKSGEEFNFAWLLVPLAGLIVLVYTIAWPIYMGRVILKMRPQQLSRYNQLGVKRTRQELEVEYNRQLSNDKSPLRFLYSAYRRNHSAYDPVHLVFFKLSTVFVISLSSPNNCLWRETDRTRLLIAQQCLLLILQAALLTVHIFTRPFNDAISNRSELCSRASYVATSVLGLVVALKGKQVSTSAVLWCMQFLSYTSSLYFAIVSTSLVSHAVKRLQRRIDWGIDVYSPHLNLAKHVRRRVWEETLSILLLTGKRFRMREGGVVAFSARQDQWPPYLLFFNGTPAERHVENLQILKQIGIDEYRRQCAALRSTSEGRRTLALLEEIQRHNAGPDAFYRPRGVDGRGQFSPLPSRDSTVTPDTISHFGKAFVVPFPPTVVFRYDNVPGDDTIELSTIAEFQDFVRQNKSEEITSAKMVRLSLRALDGQRVFCPFECSDDEAVGSAGLGSGRGKSSLTYTTSFTYARLRIAIKTFLPWRDYNFASGFHVFLDYSEGTRFDARTGRTKLGQHAVSVPASRAFGLHDTDFALSPGVATFLRANEQILRARFRGMEELMRGYRAHFYAEARGKREVMDYSFLCDVFDPPARPDGRPPSMKDLDREHHIVRELQHDFPRTLSLLCARQAHLKRSPLHAYWWLWWDELVRANGNDYSKALRDDPRINPRHERSIAWTPLPRRKLEERLKEGDKSLAKLLHTGEVNRLYFALDAIWAQMKCGKGKGIEVTLDGPKGQPKHPGSVDEEDDSLLKASPGATPTSSTFTGGGDTDAASSILPLVDQPLWRWEERLLAGQGDGARLGKGMGCFRNAWEATLRFLALEPLLMPQRGEKKRHRDLWVFVHVDRTGKKLVVTPSEERE